MKITGAIVGCALATDAYGAKDRAESAEFMKDLLVVCQKHGLALVPQDSEYDISFHEPMRVVPLTPEISKEIAEAWVCFEREQV